VNFLAAVATKLGQWLISWVAGLVAAAVARYLRRKQIDEESQNSTDPLKKAKTGDEIDKATDSALDRF
jgi:hypothetical protein